MESSVIFELQDNEDLAVFMSEGNFAGIVARKYEDALENADIIHEAMIRLKKKKDTYSKGQWMWIFTDNFTIISGAEI